MVVLTVAVCATPVTVKVPVELPAAIETVAGLSVTIPAGEAATVTLAPPVGAGPLSVIVPVAVPDPTRFDLESATE